MNKKFTWIAILIYLALAIFVLPKYTRPQQKSDATKLPPAQAAEQAYQQVRDEETAASSNKTKLAKAAANYKVKVVDKYSPSFLQKFSRKKAPDSLYAAKANLRIAIIQQYSFRDNKSIQAAQNGYKTIAKDYRDTDIGKDAELRMMALEKTNDKINSSSTMYKILDWTVGLTGKNPAYSYALALLIITVIFKLVTTPLSTMQFKSMREMQRIQPMIKELQVKYKDDQKVLGEKTMQLYKDQGVNPFASCLPILVQMPVLMLLYKMVKLYEYQFSFGKFLWIGSSLVDKFPGILAKNLAHQDIPLLVLYTVSMYISQKLTPVDPTQAEQQKIMAYTMPLMFGVMMYWWAMPSAFMLYWLFFNIVSTLHQYHVLRRPSQMSGGSSSGSGNGGGTIIEAVAEEPKRQVALSPGKANRRKKRYSKAKLDRQGTTSYPASGLRPQKSN